MTVKRLMIYAALLLSAVLLIAGCTSYNGDGFYAGETVTPEQLESIAQMIRDEQTAKYPDITGENGETLYCWIAGGTVYHRSTACYSLSKSTGIVTGTLEEALAAGKERLCSVCGDAPVEVETGTVEW